MPPGLGEAIRYWEPRRLPYNLALAGVTATWLMVTWPHFRPALNLSSLSQLVLLAALANLCYCAAYLVDLSIQRSRFRALAPVALGPLGARHVGCRRFCLLLDRR